MAKFALSEIRLDRHGNTFKTSPKVKPLPKAPHGGAKTIDQEEISARSSAPAMVTSRSNCQRFALKNGPLQSVYNLTFPPPP